MHIKLQRMPVLLLRAAYKTLGVEAIFQIVRRTSGRNKLSFSNDRNSYGRRLSMIIGPEYFSKDTTISQKCQENVSKITQRHEHRLPSTAIRKGMSNSILASSANAFCLKTIFVYSLTVVAESYRIVIACCA